MSETVYEVMRSQGITRRSFLKFCSVMATGISLGPAYLYDIARALETRPRVPVLWLHGLEGMDSCRPLRPHRNNHPDHDPSK
ncbi:MAG: twin-arginine translocation signal domain-containing protein [Leptospirales bacterium]